MPGSRAHNTAPPSAHSARRGPQQHTSRNAGLRARAATTHPTADICTFARSHCSRANGREEHTRARAHTHAHTDATDGLLRKQSSLHHRKHETRSTGTGSIASMRSSLRWCGTGLYRTRAPWSVARALGGSGTLLTNLRRRLRPLTMGTRRRRPRQRAPLSCRQAAGPAWPRSGERLIYEPDATGGSHGSISTITVISSR